MLKKNQCKQKQIKGKDTTTKNTTIGITLNHKHKRDQTEITYAENHQSDNTFELKC